MRLKKKNRMYGKKFANQKPYNWKAADETSL
jgi:hypothetical protein